MVVDGWLARAASQRPDGIALQTPQDSCTYAQLHAAARTGAGELAARGAGPGSRVAIALPAGLDFARALHACLSLGAVAVPIDLRMSAPERAQIAAGSTVLISEPLGEEPASASIPEASVHELEATAVIIHTSGTTSAPRPIELTYGNFLWSALGSAVALGLDPRERWLCALPLSHVGGLSILLRSAIYATTAVVHERFEDGPCPVRAANTGGDAHEPRGHHARTAARCRAGAPTGTALRADRWRPRARGARAARASRRRAREPHLRTHRELLAGHDHARRGEQTMRH